MKSPIGAVGGIRRSSGFELLNTNPDGSRVLGELLRFFSITGSENPTVLYICEVVYCRTAHNAWSNESAGRE